MLRSAGRSQPSGTHLSKDAARELGKLAAKSYLDKVGKEPREMFIHGKVRLGNEEWRGFEEAVGRKTNLVGVRIREDSGILVFDVPAGRYIVLGFGDQPETITVESGRAVKLKLVVH